MHSEYNKQEEFKLAEITEVRIYKSKSEGAVKAYATISLDDEFVVKGIKVLEGENGLWVGMPSRRVKDGSFQDLFHPASKEAREKIVKAVLDAFNQDEA
jgi:stage V sporulation protein G